MVMVMFGNCSVIRNKVELPTISQSSRMMVNSSRTKSCAVLSAMFKITAIVSRMS